MGHLGHRSYVEYLDAWVAEGLGEHQAGLWTDGRIEGLGVTGIDEGRGDPEPGHRQVQHVVAATVDIAAGYHVIASIQDGGHGQV